MIIETPYKSGDTVSIKLSSGEEMVARFDKQEETVTIIKKPLMLVPTADGKMGLAPFMFTVDQNSKFTIQNANIICIVKTEKNASDLYIARTSQIVTAT
jgi:hypothetical protein